MNAAVVAALAAGLCCGTADAALPGANGRIVFTQNVAPIIGPLFRAEQGLALCAASPDGSVFQRLPAVPPGAAWAPDGRIAYSDAGRIIVAGPNGQEPEAIAFGSQPSWSPDGKQIVFVASDRSGRTRLAVVSDDGSELHRLSSLSRRIAAPAWSPTGDEIAFIGLADDGAESGLVHVLSLDGSGERVLGPPGAYSAVEWSPDATRLLVADDAGGTWLVDLVDGSRRFLSAGQASWSPDGTQIAIVNRPVVILERADGSEAHVISVVLETENVAPRWLTQAQDKAIGSGSCDRWVEEPGPADGTDGPDTFFIGPLSVQLHAFAGDDRVFTTNSPPDPQTDFLDMGAGDDVVSVLQSRGVVKLGPGNDSFGIGGADIPDQGSHVVYGGSGDDYIRGGPDDDRLYGGPGNDRVRGFAGANKLYGGAGDDSITGRLSAESQLLDGGPGRDVIAGGAGNDRILARDGYADLIYCGGGRDVVFADRHDLWARDCERVVQSEL